MWSAGLLHIRFTDQSLRDVLLVVRSGLQSLPRSSSSTFRSSSPGVPTTSSSCSEHLSATLDCSSCPLTLRSRTGTVAGSTSHEPYSSATIASTFLSTACPAHISDAIWGAAWLAGPPAMARTIRHGHDEKPGNRSISGVLRVSSLTEERQKMVRKIRQMGEEWMNGFSGVLSASSLTEERQKMARKIRQMGEEWMNGFAGCPPRVLRDRIIRWSLWRLSACEIMRRCPLLIIVSCYVDSDSSVNKNVIRPYYTVTLSCHRDSASPRSGYLWHHSISTLIFSTDSPDFRTFWFFITVLTNNTLWFWYE